MSLKSIRLSNEQCILHLNRFGSGDRSCVSVNCVKCWFSVIIQVIIYCNVLKQK
jgi:hypothetical protein